MIPTCLQLRGEECNETECDLLEILCEHTALLRHVLALLA